MRGRQDTRDDAHDPFVPDDALELDGRVAEEGGLSLGLGLVLVLVRVRGRGRVVSVVAFERGVVEVGVPFPEFGMLSGICAVDERDVEGGLHAAGVLEVAVEAGGVWVEGFEDFGEGAEDLGAREVDGEVVDLKRFGWGLG